MAIKLGTNDISKMMLGSTSVDRAYLGHDLVFPDNQLGDTIITAIPLNNVTNINIDLWGGCAYSFDSGATFTFGAGHPLNISGTLSGSFIVKRIVPDSDPIIKISFENKNFFEEITIDDSLGTITTADRMFYSCGDLVTANVINMNTSNITTMGGMFYRCFSLTSLDVSNFNTSNVTNMETMFFSCTGLTSLDVSNFDTSNVTTMGTMFRDCYGLTSLDVSTFNTSNVNDMSSMFNRCFGLTSLDVSSFNTPLVTTMHSMFIDCSALTSLDLSSFGNGSLTIANQMFAACTSLEYINLVGFALEPGASLFIMFQGCQQLICITNIDTTTASDKTDMFLNTPALVAPDATEQAQLVSTSGYNYVNANPCP